MFQFIQSELIHLYDFHMIEAKERFRYPPNRSECLYWDCRCSFMRSHAQLPSNLSASNERFGWPNLNL